MQIEPKKKHPLIADSTRQFIQEGRKQKDYSLWDFVHGYVYARWPYLYIGIGKGDHPLAKKVLPVINFFIRIFGKKSDETGPRSHSLTENSHTMADGYHGKALPLETAKQLVMVNEPIHVEDLEKVIPYTKARSIILKNPDHIVVLDCPCRKHKAGHCEPMDVCMIVGEPFASFIVDHQPETSRWIDREEAIEILEAENARGHVQHAFFKDAMLGRFYAICNCCECCCGAMNAHRNGVPMLSSSGYLAQVDQDLCIGCQECHDYCQFGALYLNNVEGTSVDAAKCMGCGVCISKCATEAISLYLAPEKGIPLEIENLVAEAVAQANVQ
ncbi:MAG TPA: 4Fe-4S binding protein [Anaerolineales bacterium]|nr:4Fe-4S binding protein [Anaerolineales bacterium]